MPVDCVTGLEDPYQVGDKGRYTPRVQSLQDPDCSTPNTEGTQCFFDSVLAQILSYQSVVALFYDRMSGSIGLGSFRECGVLDHGEGSDGYLRVSNSS